WRAIARLHIEQTRYPLHIIHQYKIARRPAEAFLELIAAQSRRSLERVTGMSRRRLEVVPLAATILRRLIAAGRPDRLVFSAFGLREGYAYGVLPGGERADPLIAGAMTMARRQSRPGNDGYRLLRWISPVFPRLDEAGRRLYRAACWLSDTAWTEHPDYRAEQAFLRSLRMPVGAIEHSERAFIALALHARYGGPADDPVKAAALPLLAVPGAARARSCCCRRSARAGHALTPARHCRTHRAASPTGRAPARCHRRQSPRGRPPRRPVSAPPGNPRSAA